MIESISYFKVQ